jgi:hypothetical protein
MKKHVKLSGVLRREQIQAKNMAKLILIDQRFGVSAWLQGSDV